MTGSQMSTVITKIRDETPGSQTRMWPGMDEGLSELEAVTPKVTFTF